MSRHATGYRQSSLFDTTRERDAVPVPRAEEVDTHAPSTDVRDLEERIITTLSQNSALTMFEGAMFGDEEHPALRRDRILSGPVRWLFRDVHPERNLFTHTLQGVEEGELDDRAPAVMMAAWARWLTRNRGSKETERQEDAFYYLGQALYEAQEALYAEAHLTIE